MRKRQKGGDEFEKLTEEERAVAERLTDTADAICQSKLLKIALELGTPLFDIVRMTNKPAFKAYVKSLMNLWGMSKQLKVRERLMERIESRGDVEAINTFMRITNQFEDRISGDTIKDNTFNIVVPFMIPEQKEK